MHGYPSPFLTLVIHGHTGVTRFPLCRILYKLDELVRPYVHKILVVIEPLLIDEDYYARVEVRQGSSRWGLLRVKGVQCCKHVYIPVILHVCALTINPERSGLMVSALER